MIWSYIIWITIVVFVLGLGYFYINARLISRMAVGTKWKRIGRICLASMVLIPFVSMFLFRAVESWGGAWAWVVYVGLGFLSLLLTSLIIRDLLLGGVRGIEFLGSLIQVRSLQPQRRLTGKDAPTASAGTGRAETGRVIDPARREFLLQTTNLLVLGAAGAFTAYGIFEARRKPGLVEISVPLTHLPEAFEGFRIVQITDIHAGLTVKRDWVESIAQQVQDLRPDLIALTGDLADGSVPYLRDHVAPLAELTAPAGKFFITGNHEYYSGVEPWVREADRMGYQVLLNEHTILSRNGASIALAGVTDSSGGNFLDSHKSDPGKAIAGSPDGVVKILLAHQPRSLYEALPFGFDLQISGHTHGGQFFPWNLLATLGQPYISGLHKHENSWIYVSRGTGYWGPPVRLAARSEITVIRLTRAA